MPIQNICAFIKIWLPDCRRYRMYVYKTLHTNRYFPLLKFGQAIEKISALESGRCTSMYVSTLWSVYAVYKMHVISQNSRRKAITEGQTVSWNSPPPPSEVWVGYRRKTRKAGAEDESSCVRVCTAPCTLRSGHKKKMHRAARVQISTSESGPKYICGQRSKMAFRARQVAATLLLLKYRYGHSFLLAYIEKMAACNFLSSMKILIPLANF